MTTEEKWVEIPYGDGIYSISNLGRIRKNYFKKIYVSRKKPKFKPTIKKAFANRQGYLKVQLIANKVHKNFFVHRLVAEAFIPNPLCKQTVNHKNGIKDDNRVENLEWATQSENNKHAWTNGLQTPDHLNKRIGFKHHSSKPVAQIDSNGNIVKIWGSAKQCQKQTKYFIQAHINTCANGGQKQHKGYRWVYASALQLQQRSLS